MKIEFSGQFFFFETLKFHLNPSSGSRVVACGRTDMMKLTVAFRDFCEKLLKRSAKIMQLSNDAWFLKSPRSFQTKYPSPSVQPTRNTRYIVSVFRNRNGNPRDRILISGSLKYRERERGFLQLSRNHGREVTSLPACPRQHCCHFVRLQARRFTELVQQGS